jgi:Ribosomal protein S6
MNCYEYTFIAKQDLAENQNEKVLEKYQEIINKNSGKIIKTEEWGLRPLSYKI